MNFTEVPFLRYLFFLILGVLFSEVFPIQNYMIVGWGLGLGWITYFLILIVSGQRKFRYSPFLAYSLILALGFLLASLERRNLSKLLNYPLEKSEAYVAEALDYDIQKANSKQNTFKVSKVLIDGTWDKVDAKVLIYHQMDMEFQPGQIFLIKGSSEKLPETTGPAQFDYRKFLLRKEIAFRHFVGKDLHGIGQNSDFNFFRWLQGVRNNLTNRIENSFENEEVASVVKALLIGEKESLGPETRKAYGNAGVMHILAVSGLHVGIVYLIFLFFAKAFKFSGKLKRGYLFFVILFLWFYACLTGFSPSVVRASTMFSLFLFGQMRRSEPPFFNLLGFSALIMIAYSPNMIYDVGFQLSYLAVAGIVLLQPLILNLWIPQNRILDYFWQLTSVSIAAQLATFPLSIFYFHYFPTLFLIGNLLVLPISFLIMQIGIPWLAIGSLPIIGDALAWVLNLLIQIQNFLIYGISNLDFFRLDRLTISIPTMIFIWSVLLIIAGWREFKKKIAARLLLSVSFIFVLFKSIENHRVSQNEVILYPAESGFLLDAYGKDGLKSFSKGFDPEDISYSVDPYRVSRNQRIIPNDLRAISKESDYQFPEIGISLLLDSNVLTVSSDRDFDTQLWRKGEWENLPQKETIPLEKNAIRIIY
ncbi:ComEC/Rec2 family competence protein [Algoriphagus sediminis]|uniref:ComEC/Rec2 family competence protein n=1 Tax=Algoriphagus sediminis TaxID=3057113 RepID=A0ABT7Y9G8_9BACT|nr:ComEC/Rec2 family competence protein [Algoriphagus sediminis]MDN3203070.1 ComEC/Rec2 family competence protein [Algoriphagus sediminis]